MQRLLAIFAALFGLTGVAFGAFGAHALRARLAPDLLAIYQTGVHYQLIHAVAMLGVLALVGATPSGRYAALLFAVGIALFSGSLYILALTGVRALGMVTPLGGLCFLAGWVCLLWSVSMHTPGQ